MTEQDLKNQAAKLKAIYAQNMNTTRQNSIADYNADKTAFTTDANTQLAEQKDTTQTTKTNADINAFNNAKKLREMASAGGFTNGGELFSGTIQNEQQKGNTIGNANNAFTKYKGQWDSKLNEYNTKFNNNLNKLNSETDNAINAYNTNTDMEYDNKIDSLRQQMAAAAASAARARATAAAKATKEKELTPAQLLDQAKEQVAKAMETNDGYVYMKTNKDALVKALGQSKYDDLYEYYYGKANTPDIVHYGGGKTVIDTVKNYSNNLGYGVSSNPKINLWKVGN